jgi:hypothetical protein
MLNIPAQNPPSPWQLQVGQQLAQAVQRSLHSHPSAGDPGAAAAQLAWSVPRAAQAGAPAQLAGHSGVLRPLYEQCLKHYRQTLAPALDASARQGTEDDLPGVLACYLLAAVQAIEGHPVTPERWRALRQWLLLEALTGDALRRAPLAQQQAVAERLAVLAAALGEWSVQASRQGQLSLAGAWARSQLQAELALDADALLKALRWLRLLPAGNPSWDPTELPKAPTVATKGHRL